MQFFNKTYLSEHIQIPNNISDPIAVEVYHSLVTDDCNFSRYLWPQPCPIVRIPSAPKTKQSKDSDLNIKIVPTVNYYSDTRVLNNQFIGENLGLFFTQSLKLNDNQPSLTRNNTQINSTF